MSMEIWNALRERWEGMDEGHLLAEWPHDLMRAIEEGLFPELQRTAMRYLSRQLQVTQAALRERLQAEQRGGGNEGESGHHEYVMLYLSDTQEQQKIVHAGEIYVYNDLSGLWSPINHEALIIRIMQDYGGRPHCTKKGDFSAIADLIIMQLKVEQDSVYGLNRSPFDEAPLGAAVGMDFCRLTAEGVDVVPLAREHYQRFTIEASLKDPTEGHLWREFVEFAMPTPELKRHLAHHILVSLFRLGARMQKALFWIGQTNSGKNTMQKILFNMFPSDRVSALPPHRWDSPFDLISLRGKQLNLIGEINHNQPMDRSFISVLGGDYIEARNPHGRNITFRPEASHIINGNFSSLPTTRERHGEFWRRVDVLSWNNRYRGVPDLQLAEKIVKEELHEVLAFAFEHAAGLVDEDGNVLELAVDTDSEQLVSDWKDEASSVVEFLKCEHVRCVIFDEGPREEGDEYEDVIRRLQASWPRGSVAQVGTRSTSQPAYRMWTSVADLYGFYEKWMRCTGRQYRFSMKRFGEELERVHEQFALEPNVRNRKPGYRGIGIADLEWDGTNGMPFEEIEEEESAF